jgi:hypothetical protein
MGMAGNRADLLKASRNCEKVNMVKRAILRNVEASERPRLRFPASSRVSLTCSSNTRVSFVFVAVNATSLLVGVTLGNRGVGTVVGASQRLPRTASLLEGESTLDMLDEEFLWVS